MRDKSFPILPTLIYEVFTVISVQKTYSPGYKLTHLFTQNNPLGKEILGPLILYKNRTLCFNNWPLKHKKNLSKFCYNFKTIVKSSFICASSSQMVSKQGKQKDNKLIINDSRFCLMTARLLGTRACGTVSRAFWLTVGSVDWEERFLLHL